MEKSFTKYSDRGDPNTHSPRQTYLGDMLRKAREELGWTRDELHHATGIGTSSIVRYELAGIDEDGQYPKSTNLAKLCFALKIDPLKILLACLPDKDYGMYEDLSGAEMWNHNHPQYEWMEKQLETSLKDTMLLRSYIEHFLPFIDKENLPGEIKWLFDKSKDTLDRLSDLETRMIQLGVFRLPMGYLYMPSGLTDEEGGSWVFDFDKKGVIDKNELKIMSTLIQDTFTRYAERFAIYASRFEDMADNHIRDHMVAYHENLDLTSKVIEKENEKLRERLK